MIQLIQDGGNEATVSVQNLEDHTQYVLTRHVTQHYVIVCCCCLFIVYLSQLLTKGLFTNSTLHCYEDPTYPK